MGTTTTACNCGYSNSGYAYCNLTQGDSDWKKADDVLEDWVTSSDILNCNTDNALSSSCWLSFGDKDDYEEWFYYRTRAANYAQTQDYDSCIGDIYLPAYE